MWQKVFENDAFCGIMHETAAEQKESRSPEAPADIVILFILMKNNSPQKQAAISWIILMIGILLAVIGAMTAKEYRVNLCLLIGAMVVVGGIVVLQGQLKCAYEADAKSEDSC